MDDFIVLGLPSISILLVIAAHVLAWRRIRIYPWIALLSAWLIWPILLIIGLNNNDGHGTGLHYLDLLAMLALPFASLLALIFSGTVFLIQKKRNPDS